MSLIYSAITALENKPAPLAPATAPPQVSPPRERGARGLYWFGAACLLLILLGGVLLAGVRAYSQRLAPPAATPVAPLAVSEPVAPAIVPAPVVMPAPALSVPAPQTLPAPAVAPVAATLSPPSRPAAAPLAVETRSVAAPPQPAARAVPAPKRGKPQQAAASAPAPVAQMTDPAPLVAAIRQAIDAGKKAEADALLAQLAAQTPPENLTLLRLQAWQAFRDGQAALAKALYGKLVDKSPNDEAAVINLAVLHWQGGQVDEARRLLRALAERRPDSETVRRYLAQFGERR